MDNSIVPLTYIYMGILHHASKILGQYMHSGYLHLRDGVMESFHTNFHNIPPQIMRKFLDIHNNGTLQWPEEFREEFAPMLERHRFNKGSLSHTSLESELEHNPADGINPLSPLFETVLEPDDSQLLRNAVSVAGINAGDFTILPLIKKCAAIRINGYTLGSCRSRYSVSSVVMVSPLDQSESVLAEIQYFLWCDVSCANCNVRSYCFVAVSFYMQHPARMWFGSPAQVWAAVTNTEVRFLPITYIKSRVAEDMTLAA